MTLVHFTIDGRRMSAEDRQPGFPNPWAETRHEDPETGQLVKSWVRRGGEWCALVANARPETGRLHYAEIQVVPVRGFALDLERPAPSGGGHVLIERGAFALRGLLRRPWEAPGSTPLPLIREGKPEGWGLYPSGGEAEPGAWPASPFRQVGPYELAGDRDGREEGGQHVNPCPAHAKSPGALAFWRRMLDGYIARTPLFAWGLYGQALELVSRNLQPFQYDLASRLRSPDHEGKLRAPGLYTGEFPWNAAGDVGKPWNKGECAYLKELVATEGGGYRAPDGQHLIRALAPAMALARWTQDPIAREFIEALGHDSSLAWTLADYSHATYRPTSLKLLLERIDKSPNVGAHAIDREFAWTGLALLLAGYGEHARALADCLIGAASPNGIPMRFPYEAEKETPRVVYWKDYGTPTAYDCAPTFELAMVLMLAQGLASSALVGEERGAALKSMIRAAANTVARETIRLGQFPKSLWVDKAGRVVGASGPREEPNPRAILGLGLEHGARACALAAERVGRPQMGVTAENDGWSVWLAARWPGGA